MRLTLIRHTSLQIPAGVCYGQTDVDVAATFMHEATHARDKLKHLTFDAVFSSPLQRCVKLAHALVTDNIAHDERLKELHFGDWEMRAWDDFRVMCLITGHKITQNWHRPMARHLASYNSVAWLLSKRYYSSIRKGMCWWSRMAV